MLPLAVASRMRAPSYPSVPTSGLAMLHSCSWAKPLLESCPEAPVLAKSGEPLRSVAAEQSPGDSAPPPPRDPCPEPLDRDLTAQKRPGPGQPRRITVSPSLLLKRPWVSFKSTRGPALFKSISNQAQFLTCRPLCFLELEPAVQPLQFCELDPRSKV